MADSKDKVIVEDLNVFYGVKQALYSINLYIKEKQVTAFIGPSGCGKSTFLRSINRMNDLIPSFNLQGTIKIDNNNIYGKDVDVAALRTKVGMVFQQPNPFPKSIFDNIAYGIKIHGLYDNKAHMKDMVKNALNIVGLYDEVKGRLEDSALALSGGQQQRLCIARSIAIEPEILLMDEPCSALDPIATAVIESLIEKLSVNYTVIVVTHSMQQAARISKDTAYFHMGKLIEFGKTQKIFSAPLYKETEDYITGRIG